MILSRHNEKTTHNEKDRAEKPYPQDDLTEDEAGMLQKIYDGELDINLHDIPCFRRYQSKTDKRVARIEKKARAKYRQGVVAGFTKALKMLQDRENNDYTSTLVELGGYLRQLNDWAIELIDSIDNLEEETDG